LIYVVLAGGLGNQLFQIACANFVSGDEEVGVIVNLLNPRLNSQNLAEVSEFNLPDNYKYIVVRRNLFLLRKFTSLVLRISIKQEETKSLHFILWISKQVLKLLLNISGIRINEIATSDNVGYSKIKVRRKTLLLGYFQSYLWSETEESIKFMKQISIPSETFRTFHEYQILAQESDPLVVHIRLGDYLLEKNFGVPSRTYYNDAITQFMEINRDRAIWLFSDNLNEARMFLEPKYESKVRTFPELQNSTYKTFQVMKLGSDFVIANSSYSWWAAFLNLASNPTIICPKPWFQSQLEPKSIIPPTWSRSDARYQEN
jgi:hypothetical protein